MIRFCLLGSGSSGNATLIGSRGSKILIDNGLSLKKLLLRTAEAGESLDGLEAVFVTHEHADHVNGLGILARRFEVPVYMTRATHGALPVMVGRLPRVAYIEAGEEVVLDGMTVGSFSVSHDAADPISYVVQAEGARLGVAADLGRPSALVRRRLAGSHGLILESNYCPNLLRRGSYPPQIQQRIRGRHGHLSNREMCSLLGDLLHDALELVVLVHISAENNRPELVHAMASRVVQGRRTQVHVARQDRPTPVFEIRP